MYAAHLTFAADFESWRHAARNFLAADVAPEQILWAVEGDDPELFPPVDLPARARAKAVTLTVPAGFMELLRKLICHNDRTRFELGYRLLWRLRTEPHLLAVKSDFDVHRAEAMASAVARDMHKMTAFVRFRQSVDEDGRIFLAWFEPSHHIVDATAPFFVRRFANGRSAIMTPERSAFWDGQQLTIKADSYSKRNLPGADALEDYWRTYFASIFNPARLKIAAMQKEMPKKYWHNLPEASLIAPLIAAAQGRTHDMIEKAPTIATRRRASPNGRMSAADAAQAGVDPLETLRADAAGCKACPLWEPATQTVFGRGASHAKLMLVGEQPGDQEDLAGEPFVGPAGEVLNRALAEAGIDRAETYVTNAVKHFKFEPRGKRRIHQKPNAGEISACRWWLEQERAAIRPRVIVAMGATAGRSVLDRPVRLLAERGQPIGGDGETVLLTIHPSYLLRMPDPERKREEYAAFVRDLRRAAELAK
jgi:probable DNA metabolism protein